jgi:Protein of unknown function (DUF4435)
MRKEDITPESKITELRLDISNPKSIGKVFVLLEGESDVKLYRKLFNNDTCKIETIPGGKIFLEKGLETLNDIYKLIIGIRDADFLHLEGEKPQFSNLFLTDVHDYELMMASESQCHCPIFFEHTKIVSNEHHSTFEKLLNSIRFLGYFRWYNEIGNLEFNFRGLGLNDLFDKRTFAIDDKALIQTVLSRSSNAKIKDVEQIFDAIQGLYDYQHDLFQVCNGHDFMKVMAILCSSQQKGINEKDMASQFRVAYSQDMFKKTQLFKDTSDWASQNKVTLYHQ